MKLSFRLFVKDLYHYRKMMITSLVLFVIGISLGAGGTDTIGQWVNPAIQQMQEHSRGLAASPVPELDFFKFIFFNNAIKSVAVMALGALLGVYPALFLVMNGLVIGYLVSELGNQGENVLHLIVYGLLPHGIIEIPAILIAAGFGMQFGYVALKGIGEMAAREEGERTVIWREFFVSAIRGAFWIVILLLLAAGIESVITYNLMN